MRIYEYIIVDINKVKFLFTYKANKDIILNIRKLF